MPHARLARTDTRTTAVARSRAVGVRGRAGGRRTVAVRENIRSTKLRETERRNSGLWTIAQSFLLSSIALMPPNFRPGTFKSSSRRRAAGGLSNSVKRSKLHEFSSSSGSTVKR